MPISVCCSQCGKKYQLRDEFAGKAAKCPCGQTMTIPKVWPPAVTAVVDPPTAPAAASDPFAGITEEAGAAGTVLPPLAKRHKKRLGVKRISPTLVFLVIGVLIVAAALGGVGVLVAKLAAAMGPRWKTPEEVFAAYQDAQEHGDWRMYFETQSPEQQDDLAVNVAGVAAGITADCPALDAVCSSYGITPFDVESFRGDYAKVRAAYSELRKTIEGMSHSKKARLFTEIVEIFNDDSRLPDRVPFAVLGSIDYWRRKKGMKADERLTETEIDGDVARAQRTQFDPKDPTRPVISHPAGFVRVDGEWRMGRIPST